MLPSITSLGLVSGGTNSNLKMLTTSTTTTTAAAAKSGTREEREAGYGQRRRSRGRFLLDNFFLNEKANSAALRGFSLG